MTDEALPNSPQQVAQAADTFKWDEGERKAERGIGITLSGGGFRAVLYHLGLIRFLRDAGILPRVHHICAVSGGSIMAAHLVLNWDRYNGSAKEGWAPFMRPTKSIRFAAGWQSN